MADPRKTISHDDYLRFLGLVKLAEDHDRALEWLHRSAATLLGYVGEEPYLDNFYGGHAYDAMHGSRPPREALQLMGIEVEAPIDEVKIESRAVERQPESDPQEGTP